MNNYMYLQLKCNPFHNTQLIDMEDDSDTYEHAREQAGTNSFTHICARAHRKGGGVKSNQLNKELENI